MAESAARWRARPRESYKGAGHATKSGDCGVGGGVSCDLAARPGQSRWKMVQAQIRRVRRTIWLCRALWLCRPDVRDADRLCVPRLLCADVRRTNVWSAGVSWPVRTAGRALLRRLCGAGLLRPWLLWLQCADDGLRRPGMRNADGRISYSDVRSTIGNDVRCLPGCTAHERNALARLLRTHVADGCTDSGSTRCGRYRVVRSHQEVQGLPSLGRLRSRRDPGMAIPGLLCFTTIATRRGGRRQ
jgi:hypothetical protein